jgi:hypothetical protein
MGKIRKSKAVGRVTHIKQPGEKEFWKYVKETKGYGTKGSPVSDDIIGKAYKDLKAGKFAKKSVKKSGVKGKKSIHGNVGKRYIKSYSKDKGYKYYKDKAAKDKAVSKANKEASKARLKLKNLTKGKVAKKVVAKKIIGKVLRKFIPGVGAAIIAHDIVKGVSKSTCSKRGGKWVSGKCVGTKKTEFKAGSKVRDPISKR